MAAPAEKFPLLASQIEVAQRDGGGSYVSQYSSRLALGAAPIDLDWGYELFASIKKFGLGGDGSAAEDGEAAADAEPSVAAQDTEPGVAARLPDAKRGGSGDGAAPENG